MRLTLVLFALLFLKESFQRMPFVEEASSLVSQIPCLVKKMEYQFERSRNLGIFVGESSEYDSSAFDVPAYVVSRPEFILYKNTKGVLITLLDGLRENDFARLSVLQRFRSQFFLLIVCATNPDCASKSYMENVAKIRNGSELLYVAKNKKGIVNLYERTTTAHEKCGLVMLRKIGDCSKKNTAKRLSKSGLNFNGCPLRVAVWSNSPYARNCTSRNLVGYCSPDSRIMRHIATRLNATAQHIQAASTRDVADLVNGGKAEFGYGNLLFELKGNGYYTEVYRYVRGRIIIPRLMVAEESMWADFVTPFAPMVWLSLGITIIFIMIVRRIPGLRQITTFDIVATLSGQAIRIPTSRLPLRLFFFHISYFGAICIGMYLINRAKLLSTPAPASLNTMEEVENSGLRICGLETMREKFRDSHPRIYRDFLVVNQTEYFENLERMMSGEWVSPTYIEETQEVVRDWLNVRAIDARPMLYRNVMIVGYSNLLETANGVIEGTTELGLLQPISNQGSTGTFFVLVIGCAGSLVVFTSEFISSIAIERYQRSQRIP